MCAYVLVKLEAVLEQELVEVLSRCGRGGGRSDLRQSYSPLSSPGDTWVKMLTVLLAETSEELFAVYGDGGHLD